MMDCHGNVARRTWNARARNLSIPDADIRDMDPLEEVRRGDRARRVRRQPLAELRTLEGRPKVPHRLPDGVVEEDAAPPDAAMQLGGDEAGLPLEIGRIVGPGPQQLVRLLGLHSELVDEDHGAGLLFELGRQRDVRVGLDEGEHEGVSERASRISKTADFGTPSQSNQISPKRPRKPSLYPSRNQRPWPSPNRRVPGLASLSVVFCPF